MKKIIGIIFIILFSCILSLQNVLGQETTKKIYTHDLDGLWSTNLMIRNISEKGNWVECMEMYKDKNVVRVIQPSTQKTIEREKISSSLFSQNERFVVLYGTDVMELIDLRSLKTKILVKKSITKVAFDYHNQTLAFLTSDNQLTLFDTKTEKSLTLNNVSNFSWSPTLSIMTILSNRAKTIGFYSSDLKLMKQFTSDKGTFIFNQYYPLNNWSRNGLYFSWMEQVNEKRAIYHYGLNSKKLNVLQLDNWLINNTIYSFFDESLRVLADGNFIEFKFIEKNQANSEKRFEKWSTDEAWIYPKQKMINQMDGFKKMVWNINKKDSITEIKGNQFLLHQNVPFALSYDRKQYEPQYKFYEMADVFLNDYSTNQSTKIIDHLYTNPNFISVSPNGKYIAFFKQNNWNLYDVHKKVFKQLMSNFPQVFYDETKAETDKPPFDIPFWSEDGTSVILTSAFDLWQFSLENDDVKQLTFGEKKAEHYRIARINGNNSQNATSNNHNSIDTNNFFVKIQKDNYSNGLGLCKNGKVTSILVEDSEINQIFSNRTKTKLYYRKAKYNESPSINEVNNFSKRLIYTSNSSLSDYDLGFSKNIQFESTKGNLLNAALLYPTNYDATKIYPLIVYIYENNSIKVNEFTLPSKNSPIGFNFMNYSLDGYFVLLPDIEYEIGNPGYSALVNVETAVRKALKNSSIDSSKIGLIGHSFGGYETAFIATHSNLFKTAVIGSAITDLVSYYHDYNRDNYSDQLWRLENYQLRMGDSFYKLKNNYYQNSPLYHIEKIKIPVLIWTGKEDYNVNWYQSVYFFMGLKRLEKKAELLLFENEGHALRNKDNQQFLSKEIKNWFDFYLK